MQKSKFRILMAEDYPNLRIILKILLKNIGYGNVDEVENGMEALEKMKEKKYDLVLTDWDMPRMNGLQLIKEIRNNPATEKLPIIMLSAEDDKKEIKTVMLAGANDYIVKPFDIKVVEEKINKIFKKTKD